MARWWKRAPRPSCSRIPKATTPVRCSPPRSGSKPHPAARWRSSLQALDRGDLAAGRLDAGDGVFCVLDRGRHVVRIGVDNAVGIADDRDMAFPENQVAALQLL